MNNNVIMNTETKFIYGVDNNPVCAIVASYSKQTMVGKISLYPVIYDDKNKPYLTPEGICLSYISYEISNMFKLKEILYDIISDLNINYYNNTYCIRTKYSEYISIIEITYTAYKDSCYINIMDNENNIIETPIKYSMVLSNHYIVMYKQSSLKWKHVVIVHSFPFEVKDLKITEPQSI